MPKSTRSDENREVFQTFLKARRAARKISQKQLGEMTGTAQSTISDIENGVVSVSLDVYLRLLEALGAELSATDRIADPGQR